MNPRSVDWVRLTSHAKDKASDLGVDHSLIWGRVRNLHGICHRDLEEGGWNLHLPDKGLVIAFDVRYNDSRMQFEAEVSTIFDVNSPWERFNSDRFEKIEEAKTRA